jgi:hypothetical protein
MTLPPLPTTDYTLATSGDRWEEPRITSMDGYSDEQMHAYAAQAVAAERERLALIVRDFPRLMMGPHAKRELMAATGLGLSLPDAGANPHATVGPDLDHPA